MIRTQLQAVSMTSGFTGELFAQLPINSVIRHMANCLLYIAGLLNNICFTFCRGDAGGRFLLSALLLGLFFGLTGSACMADTERAGDSSQYHNHQPCNNFETHCCGPFSPSALSFNAGWRTYCDSTASSTSAGLIIATTLGGKILLISGGNIAQACRAASGNDCAQTPSSAPAAPSLTDHVFSKRRAWPTNSSRVYLRSSNRTSTATSANRTKIIIVIGSPAL
nr:MAG TPA_asm: hypothetical protein [Caudoviricetes sp.]